MGILELSIANVRETILLLFVPSVAQLGLPQELTAVLDLVRDHLGSDVSGVHINGTDGHNLLTFVFGQISQQQCNQRIQLVDLKKMVTMVKKSVTKDQLNY